jgi:hypothetical protein
VRQYVLDTGANENCLAITPTLNELTVSGKEKYKKKRNSLEKSIGVQCNDLLFMSSNELTRDTI